MAQHIVSRSVYFAVFAALIILALATTGLAYLDLGRANTVLAMTIAVTKAVLVVLYFMHVRYGTRLTWVFAGAGFCWLAIMLGLTLSDYLSRGWIGISGGC